MAFWYRIKPSKLKILSNEFKRCYFQIPGPCLANHTASRSRIRVLDKPTSIVHQSHIDFANNVRFFAAPVQAKPKQEEKDSNGPRMNEQIMAEFVRLVIDEGHHVVSRREALERARSLKLDLVEVQRNAKPPVCKLMDYHKEKYKQQIKEKDRAKGKSEVTLRKGDCKEVRFSGKTEQKDLQMKADMVKRLMERGYLVKCMAMGTEEQDLGGLLSCLSALIEDVSIVESGPRVEKKQAYVVVRHVKFGPSKKGSGKKALKVVGETTPDVQKVATLPPIVNPSALNQSPIHSEETAESAELGLETEDEMLFEEADTPIAPSLEMPNKYLDKKNPTWSVFDANDDIDTVFDFGDDAGVAKSSGDVQMKIAPEMVSSPANNFLDFMHPRLVDPTKTVSSSPSEAPLGTGNGYRREPRNPYPPTKSVDCNRTGARDSMRSVPQFSNQYRQPQFGLNASPSTGETKHVESDASLFGNSKSPANDIPKQEQLHLRAPGSPAPSYGIFSAPKANDTSEKNDIPAEVNRVQEREYF